LWHYWPASLMFSSSSLRPSVQSRAKGEREKVSSMCKF
jgi:hypothetical protein